MPKRPSFQITEQKEGWMVPIPASMSGTCKRSRKFFKNPKDAEKYAGRLRTQYHEGERSGVIPRQLANQAAIAAKILDPHGLSLIDVAKDAVRRLEADGNAETFRERWARIMPLGEQHWSDRYARDMGKLDRWLPKWFMDTRCSSITPEVTRKALVDGGAAALSTIENRSRNVAAVMSYQPRHRATKEISIMTPEQVVAMFAACSAEDERRAVGLMIFAGIRPSVDEGEITRLDWGAVDASRIFVSRDVSKTNAERIIPMTLALQRSIAGHPEDGPVIPAGWTRKVAAIRKAAGVAGEQDITRHTFASHYLAAFGEDAAKQAMGHTAGSRTLFKHYRRAVTEDQGRRFFA